MAVEATAIAATDKTNTKVFRLTAFIVILLSYSGGGMLMAV
jgi:hypothetical protein